jgi:hypothetical protein
LKTLHCDSGGDKRYSAFCARITVFGIEDSIENHYQLCKRFGNTKPKTWRDAKGKTPTHIEINGHKFEVRFLSQYYKLLWLRYLDENPKLVEYANQFDKFVDKFKGKSINCQADVIKQYIKQGRSSIIKECIELFKILLSWK